MIDFSGKTYAAILADMLAYISNEFDKRDTAPIPTALGPAAFTFEGFYLALDQVQRQAFVQTASASSLDAIAPLAGVSRYPASPAVRLGIFNAAVPIGARFSTINGDNSINFTVTAFTGTNYEYQLTAETPGSVGNEYSGAILPITTIPGLTSAQITDILIPGENEETDDSLRDRIIYALNNRPFGGNVAAYRSAILAIEGVGAVQVYPTWDGGGTVKCSILDGTFAPASATLIQTVQNAIDPPTQGLGLGLAPIGAEVTITTPDPVTVNVTADVSLQAGYTIELVQSQVEAAISAYISEVAEDWGTDRGTTTVLYYADVYLARITAAIVGVAGVANATSVKINGSAADLTLTETGATQEVPVMGTVTLSA